jgi:hypothetical protein
MDEYELPSGEVCAVELNSKGEFEVSMWSPEGENRWLKTFRADQEEEAYKEFERWRKLIYSNCS